MTSLTGPRSRAPIAGTRASEFKKFLTKIDSQVPEHLDVYLVCDNYGTHKSPAIGRWLQTHPRFHVHYTPTYSSWINQVERWAIVKCCGSGNEE